MISYNALLCDEITKPQNLISLQNNQYAEYEYYKFKVPFDYQKISSSYLKLMDLCSFSKISFI